jgi:protein-L-isoaspartate(D-aspartate) O-methyltransferase
VADRAFTEAQQEELAQAVLATGVSDSRVIRAFREVPRAGYVPKERRADAYRDVPLPIPHDQVTTQPSLSAQMIEALELTDAEAVLEVGTGHGFQTALLAHLADTVWSVERFADLAETARANLRRGGVGNAHVTVGDGSEGLPEHAPYDAIVVSAAFPSVPDALAGQLGPRGRLVQPIGEGGAEQVTMFKKRGGRLSRRRSVVGAHFVRLYGRQGFPPHS